MFSRSIQSDRLLSATIKGHHALLKGRSGTDKSHLLNHVFDRLATESEFVVIQLSPVTIRQALLQLAEQLQSSTGLRLSAKVLAPKVAAKARMGHRLQWDDIKRVVSRFTVPDLLSTIIRTIEGSTLRDIRRQPVSNTHLLRRAQGVGAARADCHRNGYRQPPQSQVPGGARSKPPRSRLWRW